MSIDLRTTPATTSAPATSAAATSAAAATPAPERLVREWIACGLVTAAARFVPVPLLDDLIAGRATRVAVARTLRSAGRQFDVDDLAPLLGRDEGWLSGAARYATAVPGKLLMFPLRKYRAVLTAARSVPDDVAKVVLLGHVTHARLAAGGFAGATAEDRQREAKQLRKAFDRVYDDMDWAAWRAALRATLSGVSDLTGALLGFGRRLVRRRPDEDAAPPPEAGRQVEAAVDDVRGILQRPEIARLITEFDARVAKADPYPR